MLEERSIIATEDYSEDEDVDLPEVIKVESHNGIWKRIQVCAPEDQGWAAAMRTDGEAGVIVASVRPLGFPFSLVYMMNCHTTCSPLT